MASVTFRSDVDSERAMTAKPIPSKENTIVRYVWILVVLGLSAGLILLLTISWINSYTSREREKNESVNNRAVHLLNALNIQIKLGKEELLNYLQPEPNLQNDSSWIDTFNRTVESIDFDRRMQNLSFQKSAFEDRLSLLLDLRNRCIEWNGNIVALEERIVLTERKIRDFVRQWYERIDIEEGRRRLHLADAVRKYYRAESGDRLPLGRDIVDSVISNRLSGLKMEIGELSLLVERIINEKEIDLLIDYKDNQFKPILTGVKKTLVIFGLSDPYFYAQQNEYLQSILFELFGEGVSFDDEHQTIVTGRDGLYNFIRERLSLENERQHLLDRLSDRFGDIDRFLMDYQNAMEERIAYTTSVADSNIRRASRVIVPIVVFIFMVFIGMSRIIIRSVTRQVDLIHAANHQLTAQAEALNNINRALCEEIEKRAESEKALAISEERYRSLFETSRDGIVFIDLDGYIQAANPAYLCIIGRPLEEILDRNIQDFIPEKWKDIENDIIDRHVIPRGYSDEYEKEVIRKDGSIRTVKVLTWLVRDVERRPVRMLRLIRDVTDQKTLEQELQEKLMETERQLVMINSFGAVCHYLSQPLTVLWGSLGILNRKPVIQENPELSAHIKNCLQSTDKMSSLIKKLQTMENYKTTDYTQFTEIIDLDRT